MRISENTPVNGPEGLGSRMKGRARGKKRDLQDAGLSRYDAINSRYFQSRLSFLVYPQLRHFAGLVHPVNLVKHLGDLFLDNAQVEHDVAHGHMSIVAQQF